MNFERYVKTGYLELNNLDKWDKMVYTLEVDGPEVFVSVTKIVKISRYTQQK